MKKSKAIIISVVLAVMSFIILITASVALFSDSVTVVNYLQAGTLEIGLARTQLTGRTADENGILQVTTDLERVDRTNVQTDDPNDTVFDLGAQSVPGVWQEATLEIENRGTVAFDYAVTFFFAEAPAAGSAAERLAQSLLVTVTDAQGEVLTEEGTTLADVVAQGAIPLGSISSPNAKYTFRLKIELPLAEDVWDTGAGETIMNGALFFNITVTATQKV